LFVSAGALLDADLGSLAEWVTAVAAIGALAGVAAAWKGVQASQAAAEEERRRRDDLDAAVERRRKTDQASRVWIAAAAGVHGGMRRVTVANNSSEPIYDVWYVRYGHDGAKVQRKNLAYTLPPTEKVHTISEPAIPRESFVRAHFELEFRDRRGRMWVRNGDGRLRLVDETHAVDDLL
jgi:hypothetical protein